MAEVTFTLAYEGPALEGSTMEVRSLAPALLALADLFRTAKETVNPDAPPVTLEIRATRPGSFEVHLVLAQADILATLVDLFTSSTASALSNLIQIVTGAKDALEFVGLFTLIKLLRGRTIVKRQDVDVARTELHLDNATIIIVAPEVIALYQQPEARKQAAEVVAPLQRDGIDAMEIRVPNVRSTLRVSKEDLPGFTVPSQPPAEVTDSTSELLVRIVAISFQAENKWRFSDGNQIFYATVADRDFVARVQRAEEVFRSGDLLRVILRVHQERTFDNDLKLDYTIVRVIEHISRERSVQLPMLPTGEDSDAAHPEA